MMKFINKATLAFILAGALSVYNADAESTVSRELQTGSDPYLSFPVQTFYIPLPEESAFKDMFYQINPEKARPGVVTMISMAVSTDNTVIWYDHWEDGYEQKVIEPTSTTTQVWGDGNAANGCAPDVDPCTDGADKLMAGDTIVIQNTVSLPRKKEVVFFDGGDRMQASFPIAVTRGAYPVQPGSLMAGAVEVLDTDSYGYNFEAPLGIDIGEYFQAFQFSAFFYMAAEDDTVVTLQDGSTVNLNRGEGGVVLIKQGDKLSANKKIQVDLVTGDVWSYYELRWYSLIATEDWETEYVSSVGDTVGKTKVLLYNPNPETLEISIDYLEDGSVRKTVTTAVNSGKAVLSHVIPTGSGAWFNATSKFIALSLTDTEFTTSTGQKTGSQWYDWGFPVIPRNHLTSQVLIGWGYGCTNNKCYGQEDRSVVWISPIADADVFVDYNNIGENYKTFSMKALESVKVSDDGDDDMSGAVIFATELGSGPDGPTVDIAAAWGQDPSISEQYQSISLDLGTVVLPFSILRVTKNVDKELVRPGEVLTYTIRISNVGNKNVQANVLTLFDNLDQHVTYIEGSAVLKTISGEAPYPDDQSGTKFPLDEEGHLVLADIPRRGGTYDISFQATVDEYESLTHSEIDNFGHLQKETGGKIHYSAVSKIDFEANIHITNTVYHGHNEGASCGTNKAVEQVQGDLNDPVTFCFLVTNTGKAHLTDVVVTNEVLSFRDLRSIDHLAPGDSKMIHVKGQITQTQLNVAHVTANPAFVDGTDIPGLHNVEDEDPSGVDKIDYSPRIQVKNTVYAGADEGALCESDTPKEKVEGINGDKVVYCFKVTNVGDTHLADIVLSNAELSFTDSSISLLAPGESAMIPFQGSISGNLENFADVSGNPVTPAGDDLAGIDDVYDSDPSEVLERTGSPLISIVNTVYLGNDDGASCGTDKAVEKVQGYSGESVVYCFTVTNTGDTHLAQVTVANPDLELSDTVVAETMAPGDSASIHLTTTIGEDLVNHAGVTANPSTSDGTDMVGYDDVHDSDPSEVVQLTSGASVRVENTVYLGHNNGASCGTDSAKELATGYSGADVTYCFNVVNTGQAILSQTVLTNPELSFSDNTLGTLAPGESKLVFVESEISADLTNNANVTAVPVDADGNVLSATERVSDSDPSEVGQLAHSPSVMITNTVYNGEDNGASCESSLPGELVTGKQGTPVVYCLRVTNSGNTHLTDVQVTDADLSFTDTESIDLLAPGEYAIIAVSRSIQRTFSNKATVKATPVSSTGDAITGANDVTASDPSSVKLEDFGASIEVLNTVYIGHDSGKSCNSGIPSEQVEAYNGTDVTYCFRINNNGDTWLKGLTMSNVELDFTNTPNIGGIPPGAAMIIWYQSRITGNLTNNVVVKATPANPDGSTIHSGDVQSTDPSTVLAKTINPSVKISNTVYKGHDRGASCSGSLPAEKVEGNPGDDVTYCLKVLNTGDTYLNSIIVNVPELSLLDTSIGILAPGASRTLAVPRSIMENLVNSATVTANPSTAKGVDISGTEDVTSTDSSEVAKLEFGAKVSVENTVYRGHDSGASCGTQDASEKVSDFSGSKVTYCFKITNAGGTSLADVTIDDPELFYENDGSEIGILEPGQSVTISVAKLITDDVVNTATVIASPVSADGAPLPGATPVSDSDDSAVATVANNPSISIDNTVYPGSDGGASCGTSKVAEHIEGYRGDYVTYCFTVRNTGDTHLSSVTVHNGPLSFTDLSVKTLAPGESALVIYAGTMDGTLENVVQVAANPVTSEGEDIIGADDVAASDPSSIEVVDAAPGILIQNTVYLGNDGGVSCGTSKAIEKVEGYHGENVVYCFTVTNTGDVELGEVIITDNELNFTDSTIASLSPSESATISFSTIIEADVLNNAVVTAQPLSPSGAVVTGVDPVTDTDPSEVNNLEYEAALIIENTVYLGHDGGKSCGTSAAGTRAADFKGADVTYCFEVTNMGQTHLDSISIDNPLLSFFDTSIGTLAPGASGIVSFEGVLSEDLKNLATATGNPVSPEGKDLSGAMDVTDQDLSAVVKLQHNPSILIDNTVYFGHDEGQSCDTVRAVELLEAYEGSEVSYCLTVTNTGNTHLNNVVVVDDKLSFRDSTTITIMAPGDTVTLPVSRKMWEDSANTATVTANPVTESGKDVDGAEDVTDSDDSGVAVVVANPAITITNTVYIGSDDGAQCSSEKPVDRVEAETGVSVVYCLNVTNSGDTHIDQIALTNNDLDFFDDTTIGILEPGASVVIPIMSKVERNLINTAIVTGTPVDPDGIEIKTLDRVNDSDTSEVDTLAHNPAIRIENTVYLGHNGGESCNTDVPGELVTSHDGAAVTYCFKVTNMGDTYLNRVVIEDPNLGHTDSSMFMLPPGASDIVYYQGRISGGLTNTATVTANPVTNKGSDLVELDDVTDSDVSAVNISQTRAAVKIDNTVYPGHLGKTQCVNATEVVQGSIGDAVTYCLKVTNTGNTYLGDVRITDNELSFIDSASIELLAPGESVVLSVARTIDHNLVNTATVAATPVDEQGQMVAGTSQITDSDPSEVVAGNLVPQISLDNTVYLGHDYGAHCTSNGVESVEGYNADAVVYCYKITNTGHTHLKSITLTSPNVNFFDNSIGILAPGQSELIPFQTTIDGNVTNTATVKANPVDQDGKDLPDMDNVTAVDPSQVIELEGTGDTKSGEKDPYKPPNPEDTGCMQDNYGSLLVCAAKEVFLEAASTDEVQSCVRGMPFNVTVDASMHVASSRYDITWYVATDGGDSLTGTCVANGLQDGNSYSITDGTGDEVGFVGWGNDKAAGSDGGDTCGDVFMAEGQSGSIDLPILVNTPIVCNDADEDGSLDFSICFSWRTDSTDGVCNLQDAMTAVPGENNACYCTHYNVPTVTVLEPDDGVVAPCR